jgi:hypothetical protein
MRLSNCPCGSNEEPWIESDARGLPIGYVCNNCVEQKKAKYRPEIFYDPNYECDERIEDDY